MFGGNTIGGDEPLGSHILQEVNVFSIFLLTFLFFEIHATFGFFYCKYFRFFIVFPFMYYFWFLFFFSFFYFWFFNKFAQANLTTFLKQKNYVGFFASFFFAFVVSC
jgi:hypothetical protein